MTWSPRIFGVLVFLWIGCAAWHLAARGIDAWRVAAPEVRVKRDMWHIANAVEKEYVRTGSLPVDDLPTIIEYAWRARGREVFGDVDRDIWGTPYLLAPSRDGFLIVSGGPDRCLRTKDDLRVMRSLLKHGYKPTL